MWIDLIIELLPVIIPLIEECIERDGREVTFDNLRKMPARVQWFMFREARKRGYNVRVSRQIARETWQLVLDSSDDDLEVLLNQDEQ